MTTETVAPVGRATGPRTAEGKAAVARNRVLHNLTGAQVLLPGESREAYEDLLETLLREHAPGGATERFLVDQLAQNQWRLVRIAEMESEIFAAMAGLSTGNESPAALAARRMAASSSPEEAHARLTRYEASIRRAYHAALTQLRVTQNTRLKCGGRPAGNLSHGLSDSFEAGFDPQLVENPNYDSNSPLSSAGPPLPRPEPCRGGPLPDRVNW